MPDLSWVYLPVFGVIALIVILMMLVGRRFADVMREAGRRLGLEWASSGLFGPGELSGVVEGEQVSVFVTKQGVGSFSRIVTLVEVDLHPPLPGEFRLGRENFLNKLVHRLGSHDFEFGDPEFDALYRVTGSDPHVLGRVFNAEAREMLVRLAKGSSDLHVTPDRIRWEKSGRVMKPDVLERVVLAGVGAARAMRRRAA